MNKKILYIFAFTFFIYSSANSAQEAQEKSMVGNWKTIDDKTGEEKSIVQIWLDDKGNLNGKIVKLFPKPGEDPNPVCDKCKGDKKNAPSLGMQIMWGFTPDHKKNVKEWNSGKILDPKNGVEYSCNLKLNETKDKLEVRGFVGFSFIGRSQTWLRIAEK
jgi:uncharacterized protein (DUF2147 family)